MKTFLMRKMLASKMKGVPQAEQDKIFNMIEKNPDFFQKIGIKIQAEMKNGKDQMTATQVVVKKYETEFKGLI